MSARVSAALVHHPVVDKNGLEIASSLTPTDLHDLARSARTYGLERLWITTPLRDQQRLAGRMMGFWQTGIGAGYNPNRGQALDLIRVRDSVDQAVEETTADNGRRPLIWATSARGGGERLDFARGREIMDTGRPVLILFGTAWGLAPAVLEMCDNILAPLAGAAGVCGQQYNHLSVRSAAAVILDRLLGRQ